DGKMFTWDDDRRLFQYRFLSRSNQRSWTDSLAILDRARAFPASPQLRDLRTPPPRMLWAWNAEGWYVALKDSRVLAFTTENGTTPPAEVIQLFEAIE